MAFLSFITLFYLTACNYYKVATYTPDTVRAADLRQMQKLLFIHNGEETFFIKSLTWKDGAEGKMFTMGIEDIFLQKNVIIIPSTKINTRNLKKRRYCLGL